MIYKDWILKFRLSLVRVKDAWMDLFDIQDLRDLIPFDPQVFTQRWNIMMAWKAFRLLENADDPLLMAYEVDRQIGVRLLSLTRQKSCLCVCTCACVCIKRVCVWDVMRACKQCMCVCNVHIYICVCVCIHVLIRVCVSRMYACNV